MQRTAVVSVLRQLSGWHHWKHHSQLIHTEHTTTLNRHRAIFVSPLRFGLKSILYEELSPLSLPFHFFLISSSVSLYPSLQLPLSYSLVVVVMEIYQKQTFYRKEFGKLSFSPSLSRAHKHIYTHSCYCGVLTLFG